MYKLPPACYLLTTSNKYRFIDMLKCIKVLDGYASIYLSCITVKDRKIFGLRVVVPCVIVTELRLHHYLNFMSVVDLYSFSRDLYSNGNIQEDY